jgi:hypothetical protein
MAMTPEAKVKRAISALLKSYGDALYYEMPVPTGFGKSGLDYHGCKGGRYFAIEAKAPGKKPTPRQIETIRKIVLSGGRVFIIDKPHSDVMLKLEEWLNSCR